MDASFFISIPAEAEDGDGFGLRVDDPVFWRHHGRKSAETEPAMPAASTAAEALDRITLPPEAIERISTLILPGSSLIVSDNTLSDETDADTDLSLSETKSAHLMVQPAQDRSAKNVSGPLDGA